MITYQLRNTQTDEYKHINIGCSLDANTRHDHMTSICFHNVENIERKTRTITDGDGRTVKYTDLILHYADGEKTVITAFREE